jgi:hypothetical protein
MSTKNVNSNKPWTDAERFLAFSMLGAAMAASHGRPFTALEWKNGLGNSIAVAAAKEVGRTPRAIYRLMALVLWVGDFEVDRPLPCLHAAAIAYKAGAISLDMFDNLIATHFGKSTASVWPPKV